MSDRFEVGDHVWDSEAGEVTGRVTKVHTVDFDYTGRARRASDASPPYEITSVLMDRIAVHKGDTLHHVEHG